MTGSWLSYNQNWSPTVRRCTLRNFNREAEKKGIDMIDKDDFIVANRKNDNFTCEYNASRDSLYITGGNSKLSESTAEDFLLLFGDLVFNIDSFGEGRIFFKNSNVFFSDLRDGHEEYYGTLNLSFEISSKTLEEMNSIGASQSLRVMELCPGDLMNWFIELVSSKSIVSSRK